MKDISKRLVLILSLILMVFGTIPAYAEIVEQDNLKVKLQIEEVDNSKDEFKAILIITNIGIRDIENVDIENIIPKEISIKDKNYLKEEIGSINAGETLKYEFYCNVKPIAVDEDKNNNQTIITPETNNSNGNINSNSNGITDISNSILDKIETGDDNIILISVICIFICASLIILLSKKKIRSNKKFISIFICISIIASSFQGMDIVKAEENNNREIKVKENIEIDNKVYTLETKVKYKIPNNKVVASGEVITRGEWISKLVEIFNLKDQQQLDWDQMEYPFDDIEGNQYEEDVLYAYINSILFDEGDSFNSEAPATREFATVTAIRALGFVGDKDIICEDSSDITYLKEIEVAVSMDIVNLDGNKFYPLRELTQSEYDYIVEGIQGVLNSTEISEDYNNSFEYKEGVVKLSEDITYKIDGTSIIFNTDDRISKLKSGDIVVLPNETPYKVTNITVNDDNVVVETEEPTIEETLKYVDVQGYANGDSSDFIPAEGVEVIQNNQGNARLNLDEDGSISMPGAITLSIDHDDVSGEVKIDIPKIEYKVDIDVGASKVDVNNAYLKVLTSTEFTGSIELGSLEGETEEFFDGTFELGKIPIAGIPGVTVVVAVAIKYEAEGTAKLVYSLNGSLGAQVLNNKLRGIKTLKSSLQLPYLEAEGKIGPNLSALIEICSHWNLIDFSIDAGLGVNGTLMIHPGLLCMDSNIFLYGELTVLDECEIKEWLDLSYTIEIWNADNSPLKWNWHLENFNKVPSCTYGEGTIKGAVVEAGNRSSFIKDSLIQVYSKLGILVDETTSDSNGQYELSLNAGTYKIKISKNGYIPFESTESVIGGEETFIQTYLMVGQGADGQVSSSGGKITNAITGGDISGITINIRNGWNNLQGDPILTTVTNDQGIYNAILPLGNYTVEMIKEGYITKHYNIYVMEGNSLNQNNTLIPSSTEEMPAGDLRVVLTWGEEPRDLDSHLVGPTADGNDYFHIYFADKLYSENNITYADLDLDDRYSYGPETTTIYNMNNEGKYSFYVHDYTNKNYASSYEMSNSGAKVEVYKGDTLYATYNIPTNNIGTYWHVFDFDAKTNSIVPVNNFVDGINYNNLNTASTLFNIPTSMWQVEEKQAS